MNEREIAEALARFPTGNLCNANSDVRAMRSSLQSLYADIKIAGPAKTVRIVPGQNAAIHHAVHTAQQGQVLVVDADGDRGHGPFGDILASACINRGIVGLIIDGTVRDSAEIRQLKFPVFCLGTNPTATAKSAPGEIDIEIGCGDVRVRPGDIVVGDDDGVVVVPKEIASSVIEQAGEVDRKEQVIKERLAQGETTYQILNIGP
ncbi:MAG: RraA family protein [Pseudomonadota bacterium]